VDLLFFCHGCKIELLCEFKQLREGISHAQISLVNVLNVLLLDDRLLFFVDSAVGKHAILAENDKRNVSFTAEIA